MSTNPTIIILPHLEIKKIYNLKIKAIIPRSAILIVDVQNDFVTGTLSLINCPAKQDAREVVPCINHLLDTVPFSAIAYTLDWHPENHCSFIENVTKRKLSKHSRVKKKENTKYLAIPKKKIAEMQNFFSKIIMLLKCKTLNFNNILQIVFKR